MKVGIIGPIWQSIPPKGYGGTELVVYNLVNGLVDRGHDVTLFGAKSSRVKAKVFPTVQRPLREDNIEWTNIAYILYHITEAFDRAGDFDILHMHLNKSQDYAALPLAKYSKTPVIFTIHFQLPSPQGDKKDRYRFLMKYKDFAYTSISNTQRGNMPLNFVATIYNALDVSLFPFRKEPEDYFVWIGKINPLKGTKEAILAAKKAGVVLKVIGAVDLGVPEMLSYYQDEIKPLIDGKQIQWVGEVDVKQKADLLGKAKAFLNPIQWEEPYGLVMVEAQVCGTPVISFARGAAPELVKDGLTGYLVENVDQMVEKMSQINNIDRRACRENVENRFSIPAMIDGYEKSYNKAIMAFRKQL